MSHRLDRLVGADWFHRAVVVAIVGNAILLGLETSPTLVTRWGRGFDLLHAMLSAWFVTELSLRVAATWPDLRRFAADRWNLFDLVVVVLSLLPQAGPLALVARLGRLLRVARMISVIPELRLLAGTMLRSLGSLGHILLLLGLIGYGYALVGVTLFAAVDPEHWGSLGRAALTLFEVVTLEGWADLQAAVIADRPWAWLYFASFIVLAVFVVINLFIAVVINNLEKTKREIDPGLPLANDETGHRRGTAHLAALRRWRRSRAPHRRRSSSAVSPSALGSPIPARNPGGSQQAPA